MKKLIRAYNSPKFRVKLFDVSDELYRYQVVIQKKKVIRWKPMGDVWFACEDRERAEYYAKWCFEYHTQKES